MSIGIFSRTFAGDELSDVLGRVRQAGFGAVHLSLASAGLEALPAELSTDVIEQIGAAVRTSAVTPVGVSATFNAAHPDPAERADGLARAVAIIERAKSFGTDFVSLCTGSRSPSGMWTYSTDNSSPEAWRDARATLAELAEHAERAGVRLGVEPERANVVDGAKAARRMLDELGSSAVRIIFDGANLLERDTGRAAQREIFAEAFDLLAPDIAIVHAKDHDASGVSVRIGTGRVAFDSVIDLMHRHGIADSVPVVTHNLPEADAPAACTYLTDKLSR